VSLWTCAGKSSGELGEGLSQFGSRRLPCADSVDGSPVGPDERSEFSAGQVIQERHDVLVEVIIISGVVVFGDDFV
jgi:hypothetical protein